MLWIVGHDFSLSDRIFADILKRESHPPNSKPLKHRGKEATEESKIERRFCLVRRV